MPRRLHSLFALLILAVAPAASADLITVPMGGVDGLKVDATSHAGTVLAGEFRNVDGDKEAYRWDVANSAQPGGLGFMSAGNAAFESKAHGISATGSVVVGESKVEDPANPNKDVKEAFMWNEADGMMGLGFLSAGNAKYESKANSVSADGLIVVGESKVEDPDDLNKDVKEAFIWTAIDGMEGLGFLSDGSVKYESKANDIARDRLGFPVVVGQSKSPDPGNPNKDVKEAFIWTPLSGMLGLGFLSDGNAKFESEAAAISADGSTVVGTSKSTDPANPNKDVKEAFIWTEAGGMVGLGFLSDGSAKYESKATGVSPDGSMVVGESDSADGKQAFIWTAAKGMMPAKEVLENRYLIDLTGWTLDKEIILSPDGRNLILFAEAPDGSEMTVVASLQPADPIPALPPFGTVLLAGGLCLAAQFVLKRRA